MFGLSFWEMALILAAALLFVGPKRLPEMMRTLGQALRSVRRASSEVREALEEPLNEVREPLEDVRSDLTGAVHSLEREIHDEVVSQDSVPARALDVGVEPSSADPSDEGKDREQ